MAKANCQTIINYIESLAPKKLALDWDNVGLLVGQSGQKIKKIMVALDLPEWVLDEAIEQEVDMIITHHPMIFAGIKKINTDNILGRKIIKLIQNNISVYAAHTNYDIANNGLNDIIVSEMGFNAGTVMEILSEDGLGLGRLINITDNKTGLEIINILQEKLDISNIKYAGDIDKKIKKLAVLNGAGNSFIKTANYQNADMIITGDVQYHAMLDAIEAGMCVVDAGHYGTEKIMINHMTKYLQEKIKNDKLDVEVILSKTNTDPFHMISKEK